MPALTKVNSKKKNKEVKKISIWITVAIAVGCLFVEGIFIFALWELKLKDDFYTSVINENKDIGNEVYVATRDIASGEIIDGSVEYRTVPSYLVTSDSVVSDTGELRASRDIVANTIITNTNTYNPKLEDVVIDTSRQVVIDYLETPGINQGDYIDIRLKVFSGDDLSTYDDKIVASKKCLISKDDNGSIELILSEADILNLNSAVVEAAGVADKNSSSHSKSNRTAVLYVTKYVDPANQPKADVTYSGKGRDYTQKEIQESQTKLKAMMNGESGYYNPTLEQQAHSNSFGEANEANEATEESSSLSVGEEALQ